MRIPKTLYVIADGGRVRYIERVGPGRFNTFRKFVSVHMHEKAAELSPGKPGRVHESMGAARHAIAQKINPRDKVEAEFIRVIAEDLRQSIGIDRFVVSGRNPGLRLPAIAALRELLEQATEPTEAARAVRVDLMGRASGRTASRLRGRRRRTVGEHSEHDRKERHQDPSHATAGARAPRLRSADGAAEPAEYLVQQPHASLHPS